MVEVEVLKEVPSGAVYVSNAVCDRENFERVAEVTAKHVGIRKIGVIVSERADGKLILNMFDLEGKFRRYSDPHMSFDIWN